MLNFIDKLPTDEAGWSKYELKDISSRYSSDVIASLAFGISINSFDEKETAFWMNGGTLRSFYLILSSAKANVCKQLLLYMMLGIRKLFILHCVIYTRDI